VIVDVTLLCGISVMTCSDETSVKVELVAPKKTAEASCRFLPLISTREPSGPLVGEIRRISGRPVCAITSVERVEISASKTNVAIVFRFPMSQPDNGTSTGEDAPAYIDYLTGLVLRLLETALALRWIPGLEPVACARLQSYIGVSWEAQS